MEHIFGKHQSPIDISKPIKSDLPDLSFKYKATQCKPHDNHYSIEIQYDNQSLLYIGDHEFHLLQFHFHTPAEHSFDGQQHPMIAHLVHKNTHGFYAVIAVIVDEGKVNPYLQKLIGNLEDSISFDATNLLPSNTSGYYYYHGSLTTKPYSENVHWIILKDSITASKEQIAHFEKVMHHNARELQPAFDRVVRYRD